MIQTRRHLLVPIEDVDIKNIYKGLGNPKVTEFYGVHFDSLKATDEQMEWYKSLVEDQKGIWFKAIRIKTGHFVGACGFNDWDHDAKKAEIGIWILPNFWGKGRMNEILDSVIDYGFDRLGLETIEAFVESGNINCINAMKKTRMKFVECQKGAEEKDGQPIDIDVFQIHRSNDGS